MVTCGSEVSSVIVKRLKKANFSDRENICLLEEVQANYGLLTQTLKTGNICAKKRGAWTKITEAVNAVGGQGRAASAVQKRWKDMRDAVKNKPKAATRTGGGPPEPPVPYEDFILTILGENSNLINGIVQLDDVGGDTFQIPENNLSSEYETRTDSQVSVMKPPQVEHTEYFDDITYSSAHEMLDENNIEDSQSQVYNISLIHCEEAVSFDGLNGSFSSTQTASTGHLQLPLEVPVPFSSTPSREHRASHNSGQSQQAGSSHSSCSSQLQNHNQTSVSTRNLEKTTSNSKSTSNARSISKRQSASSSLAHGSILQKKKICDRQGEESDLEDEKVLNKKWLKAATALNKAKLELIQLKKKNLELETRAKVELMQLEKRELVLRIKKLEQDTADKSCC